MISWIFVECSKLPCIFVLLCSVSFKRVLYACKWRDQRVCCVCSTYSNHYHRCNISITLTLVLY